MAENRLLRELKGRGIHDERVLKAMAQLDRAEFVPEGYRAEAQGDYPLPIGFGQTISQPYIVAFMSQSLGFRGDERVLEIGTGSGYQAAVLGQLCREVFTIEIVPELAEQARQRLNKLGFDNVHVRQGDGYSGWADAAPFDAIMLTAAPSRIPEALLAQLSPGGRLIAPVGSSAETQELVLVRREKEDGLVHMERLLPVRFVPMTGEAEAL